MKYSSVITILTAANLATALYIRDHHSILSPRGDEAVNLSLQPRSGGSPGSSQPRQRNTQNSSPSAPVRPASPPQRQRSPSPVRIQHYHPPISMNLDADVADSIGGPVQSSQPPPVTKYKKKSRRSLDLDCNAILRARTLSSPSRSPSPPTLRRLTSANLNALSPPRSNMHDELGSPSPSNPMLPQASSSPQHSGSNIARAGSTSTRISDTASSPRADKTGPGSIETENNVNAGAGNPNSSPQLGRTESGASLTAQEHYLRDGASISGMMVGGIGYGGAQALSRANSGGGNGRALGTPGIMTGTFSGFNSLRVAGTRPPGA